MNIVSASMVLSCNELTNSTILSRLISKMIPASELLLFTVSLYSMLVKHCEVCEASRRDTDSV